MTAITKEEVDKKVLLLESEIEQLDTDSKREKEKGRALSSASRRHLMEMIKKKDAVKFLKELILEMK